MPNPGDSPTEVTAGIDNAGSQAIAWVVEDGFVRVSTRAPGGGFSAPATISAAGAESPLLSVAPGGAAFVVWLRRTESTSGGTTTMVTRVERAQIGVPGVATLATATLRTDDDGVADGAELREPQIAAGAPTVLWKRQTIDANNPNSDADDVVTDTLVASVDGGGPQTLRSTTTSSIGGSSVDEAPDGTAAVAWDEGQGAASAVRVSLRAPGGAFGGSEVVSTGGLADRVSEPRVAIRAPAQPVPDLAPALSGPGRRQPRGRRSRRGLEPRSRCRPTSMSRNTRSTPTARATSSAPGRRPPATCASPPTTRSPRGSTR